MKMTKIYFVIFILILIERISISDTKKEISDDELRNVGTTLIGVDGTFADCVTNDEASLFKARQEFDLILPFTKNAVMSEKAIEVLMEYFYGANEIIQKMSTGKDKVILMKAYFDTIGGYLNHYLIPIAKFSFYSGEISLRSVKFVVDLLEYAKNLLNTNGLGWAEPIREFQGFAYKIEPLKISLNDPNCNSGRIEKRSEKPASPCISLILINDENSEEDIIVSLPKVEIEEGGIITNMWLPYKRKHIFSLQSKTSAYILLKYYVDVTKCYKFQDISQEYFNKKFYRWLSDNIVPHLFNGKGVYPALGAVLRILETVKAANQSVLTGNQVIDQANHKPIQPLGDTDEELSKINDAVQTIADSQGSNIFTRFFGNNKASSKAEADRVQKDIIKLLLIFLLIIFIIIIVLAFVCQKRKTDQICKDVLNREMPFYQKCLRRMSICNNTENADEVNIKTDSSSIHGGPSPRNAAQCSKPRKKKCCPMSSCFAGDKKKNENENWPPPSGAKRPYQQKVQQPQHTAQQPSCKKVSSKSGTK